MQAPNPLRDENPRTYCGYRNLYSVLKTPVLSFVQCTLRRIWGDSVNNERNLAYLPFSPICDFYDIIQKVFNENNYFIFAYLKRMTLRGSIQTSHIFIYQLSLVFI